MCRFTRITLSLATLATLGACPAEDGFEDPDVNIEARLSAFNTCDGLREYVADSWTEQYLGSYGYGIPTADVAMEDSGSDGEVSSAPTDFSTTNVQEQGVDEPDIVKTDGEYIYSLQENGELIIVDSWPAEETAVVGRVDIGGYTLSMFLDGDRVVVFSSQYGSGWDDSRVRATILNVTDRTNPIIVRTVEIGGYYSDARMIDGDVYLVANHYTYMPSEVWEAIDDARLPEPYYGSDENRARISRKRMRRVLRPLLRDVVNDMELTELLPQIWDGDGEGEPSPELLMDCHEVYRSDGLSSPNLVSIAHFDLAEGESGSGFSGTGAMSEGWEVYASDAALYLSATSWNWYWGYGDIPPAVTHFHKFDLAQADTRYAASGVTDGWLLNSYSMSEFDGFLRVATTDFTWWWGGEEGEEQANNVFVLGQYGNRLIKVGEETGIAPGEQIQSARFQGEKGYLVTFEQIDPFFTLDLSDAFEPRVVGELKLPGFSSYLKPLDANNVLAIGQDGDNEGRITGLAVTLFDVSDFANPKVRDQISFTEDGDWSSSAALWDPHAFTLHNDVLSIPLYHQDWDYAQAFSGLVSIDVNLDVGLAEIGRLDHSDMVADSDCEQVLDRYHGGGVTWEGEDEVSIDVPDEEYGDCHEWAWNATMRRSVVIEGYLYSISNYGVKVTDLLDPTLESARALFYPAQ